MECDNFYLTFVQDFNTLFFLETNHAAFHYHKGAYMYHVVEIYSCIIFAFHYLYMPPM